MNKKLLMVFGLIVLLGLGYFFFGNRATNQPFSPTGPRTLAGILGLDSQMCTFEDSETGDKGTYYVARGSMRGDVTTTTDGKTQVSHMVYKDGFMYTWMDGEATGYKMVANFEEEESAENSEVDSNVETSTTFDTEEEFDYNCSSWRVDSSKFELPEGIEFIDFSQYTTPTLPSN